MLMRAATVVQVSLGLFYVLLQLLVVAAMILSFNASFIAVEIPPLHSQGLHRTAGKLLDTRPAQLPCQALTDAYTEPSRR